MDQHEPRADGERGPGKLARAEAWLDRSGRRLLALAGMTGRALVAHVRRVASRPRARRIALVVGRDVLAALAIVLLALAIGRVCFERIDPGTVGVLQKNWGAEREIATRDFPPGVHFAPRFLYSWHRVDARTRVLSFARKRDGGEHPALEVRTPKGPTAQICARVPYRIAPGAAHRVVEDGMKSAYPMRVRSTVEKVLVEELSKLDTDALCDPDVRQAAAEVALVSLNAALAPLHVLAEGVFVDAIYFAPSFEKTKQDEQLASQTRRTEEVLHQLRLQRLEGESIATAVEQAKQSEIARASRVYADEKELWEKRRLADQKIEIELLEQELARAKQTKLDELSRGFEALEATERDAVLTELAREHEAAKLRVAHAARELESGLARTAAQARRAAEAELESLRVEGELAAGRLARAEQAELATLELELAQARATGDAALRERQRASQARAANLRREADGEHGRLLAEGEVALAAAESLREELEAAALAQPGARMLLARDAATNLNLARVALDSNDPRVPSVLDLDALVALLVGKAE